MRISFTERLIVSCSHLPPLRSLCPSGNPTSFAPLLSGHCVQMRFSIDPASTLLPCSYFEEEEIFRAISRYILAIIVSFLADRWKHEYFTPLRLEMSIVCIPRHLASPIANCSREFPALGRITVHSTSLEFSIAEFNLIVLLGAPGGRRIFHGYFAFPRGTRSFLEKIILEIAYLLLYVSKSEDKRSKVLLRLMLY